MLRPAARHYGVVVGRVCLDSFPRLPCWGRWFSRGRDVGLAGLVVLNSGGSITSVLLWIFPEFCDVALMSLGAWCDGWEEAIGVCARSVSGGSDFNSDLFGCLGKGGAMVVEGWHGWGCEGSGGLAAATMVVWALIGLWAGVALLGLNL
ncbi:hypothetical protein M0R45_031476 [Rubus argutus]|uniref:NADH dehydrogenase subunit 6 n=1 Tax=Rubus argutus TaxID=59490 RepID=A0AAW1WED8_RUBAR